MNTTAVRLLEALTLLQTRRDWSGTELAERLGVDVRTLRRDMRRLRELGYEIDASTGLGGGYRLGAGTTLPALRLDQEEAVTISIALTSLNALQPQLADVALRVLVKLQQILPTRLQRRARDLQEVTLSMTHGPRVDASVLGAVAAACREHERLRFEYGDFKGTATKRDVEPLKLLHTGHTWYLVAWDVARTDWRTFRVDRIAPRSVVTGERFVPRPPPDDLAKYASNALGVAPYEQKASVRLLCSLDEARERVPAWVGLLEPMGKYTRLRLGGTSPNAIASQLLLAGVDFDSLEPAALVDPVRRAGERLTRGTRKKASAPNGDAPTRRRASAER